MASCSVWSKLLESTLKPFCSNKMYGLNNFTNSYLTIVHMLCLILCKIFRKQTAQELRLYRQVYLVYQIKRFEMNFSFV